MVTRRTALAALLVLLSAAGCDVGPGAGDDAPGEAEAALASVDRSGVTGTVRAEHEGDEAEVELALEGLRPGERYLAALHAGRCAAGGVPIVPLGEVDAGEDGTARIEREVAGTDLSPDEPAFVQVEDAAGNAVACADLPGHGRAEDPLTERIAPDTGAGGGGEPAGAPRDTAGD